MMVDYIKVYQKPNLGSMYAKAQKDDNSSLMGFTATVKAQKEFKYWENLLHVAWYPQAKYTIITAPKNMKFEEVGWAMTGGGFNYRGELTKAFLYACDVAGTYPVEIEITFPELSDYKEVVSFMVKIE